MTDCFAEVNGLRLHYLDHPGEEPTLVLMPGLTANAHCFDGLVQAGLSPRFRVFALDLRGRGLSDKPRTGYGMAEHARDVLGLLDHWGVERAVLGGHSFGALLSLFIAAYYPGRVEKLILLDAAAQLHPRVRELVQPSLDRLGQRVGSWEEYLNRMRRAPHLAGFWDPAIERYYQADVEIHPDGTVQARSTPENMGEAVEKAAQEPWDQYVSQIQHPALLLNAPGPYGPPGTPAVVPKQQALETVRALAHCRYVEIPGNHMTMLFGDHVTEVVEAIVDFVSDPSTEGA